MLKGFKMTLKGNKIILSGLKTPTKRAVFGLFGRIVAHDSDVSSDLAWVKTGYRLGTETGLSHFGRQGGCRSKLAGKGARPAGVKRRIIAPPRCGA